MHDDLQRLDTEVTMALAGLDARQTQSAPLDHPNKWTIQQIAEHLLLSFESSRRAIAERLEKRTATRSKASLRQRFSQWVLLSAGHFPGGAKSPPEASPDRPAALQTGDTLADRVHGALVEFAGTAARAEELFGNVRSVSHAALGPLSIAQWRRFHLVHGKHHLRQVARIRQTHGF